MSSTSNDNVDNDEMSNANTDNNNISDDKGSKRNGKHNCTKTHITCTILNVCCTPSPPLKSCPISVA